jgi:hypothetical protein
VCGIPIKQAIFEARQTEKVVLFFEKLDWTMVDRALIGFAISIFVEFVVLVVLLTCNAVLAGEFVEFDVASVVTTLQQLGDGRFVSRLGGANEVVVRDVQLLPGCSKFRRNRVSELLRGDIGRFGGLLDFQAVFVGAGEVLDVVAEQPMPARQCVADDGRVGVAEVRLGVDVIDGGRHIEPSHECTIPSVR